MTPETGREGPPPGYALRRPTPDDRDEVYALVAADERAEFGSVATTAADLTVKWTLPRFALETDSWLVVDPDDRVAGYVWVWDPAPGTVIDGLAAADPALEDRPLDEYLIDLIEERALELTRETPASARPNLGVWCNVANAGKISLYERRGFAQVRIFISMELDLSADLDLPQWPAGIALRTIDRQKDGPQIHAAMEEAFSDHFRFTPQPYAEWEQELDSRPDLDDSLWFVAGAGERVAGTLLALAEPGKGYIAELAVVPEWRGRGLGTALLLHAFDALRDRGQVIVKLGVDAENATGAVRLYERIGMRAVQHTAFFSKNLPPAGDRAPGGVAS